MGHSVVCSDLTASSALSDCEWRWSETSSSHQEEVRTENKFKFKYANSLRDYSLPTSSFWWAFLILALCNWWRLDLSWCSGSAEAGSETSAKKCTRRGKRKRYRRKWPAPLHVQESKYLKYLKIVWSHGSLLKQGAWKVKSHKNSVLESSRSRYKRNFSLKTE